MPSLSQVFLFGIFSFFILYILKFYLKGLQFVRRLQNLIGRNVDVFEQVQDSDDDDEGVVDDEFLFSDLNPEQSVEKYRRMRFEAAAAVLRNSINKTGSTDEKK